METCELLLPPMILGEERYEKKGDRVQLSQSDAILFAGQGVVKRLESGTPELSPETELEADTDEPEAKKPLKKR